MAVIKSETCHTCDEEFFVLIGDGNDDIPETDMSCKWVCPGCGHAHIVAWRHSPSAATDEADLRIVPDDFHEFGLVIADRCGERHDTPTSGDMPTA